MYRCGACPGPAVPPVQETSPAPRARPAGAGCSPGSPGFIEPRRGQALQVGGASQLVLQAEALGEPGEVPDQRGLEICPPLVHVAVEDHPDPLPRLLVELLGVLADRL